MKIGILGTIWINTPPRDYGGTEQVIYNLVNGLSSRGHDVTLFGPGTAQIKAALFPTVKFPLRELDVPWTDILYHLYHITQAFDHAGEFDILHVHINREQDLIALPLAMHSPIPVLFTFHGLLPNKQKQPDQYHMLLKYKHFPYTSISDSQRAGLPLHFIQTVYNSINLDDYPFVGKEQAKPYLVWLGKVNPRKGTKEAILAAQKVKKEIYVMGKIDRNDRTMYNYYKEEIKPMLGAPYVHWQENVGLPQKAEILGHAQGMLNPIQWDEPFGLVMAESQATGTPVIACNRGSAPEVIENGKTGFLADSLDELVAKIAKLDTIDRNACRSFVEKKFSVDHMVSSYESAYTQTIKEWPHLLAKQQKYIAEW